MDHKVLEIGRASDYSADADYSEDHDQESAATSIRQGLKVKSDEIDEDYQTAWFEHSQGDVAAATSNTDDEDT